MRNGICAFLMFLAIIPAVAQNAPNQDCHAKNKDGDGAAATVAQDYADRVNGLLRDTNASLQEISGRVAAGELSPAQADRLKLAATRTMMARLETISAVFDAKIDSTNKDLHGGTLATRTTPMQDATRSTVVAKSTVRVQDLRRENGQ